LNDLFLFIGPQLHEIEARERAHDKGYYHIPIRRRKGRRFRAALVQLGSDGSPSPQFKNFDEATFRGNFGSFEISTKRICVVEVSRRMTASAFLPGRFGVAYVWEMRHWWLILNNDVTMDYGYV